MEQWGEAPILPLLPTPAQVNLPPDLTKAQIAELQKALPKCKIHSNPTK
jgi:hypothetical protein